MRSVLFALAIVTSAACSEPPQGGSDAGDPGGMNEVGHGSDVAADPCASSRPDTFVIGEIDRDDAREFRRFAPGCDVIEVRTGIQGGWHVEPAILAPELAMIPDLGGEVTWRILDAGGNTISAEARYELFRTFWTDLDVGFVYWGDFVRFIQYPEAAIDEPVTLELFIDFDDESSLEDLTVETLVTLRDEVEEGVF